MWVWSGGECCLGICVINSVMGRVCYGDLFSFLKLSDPELPVELDLERCLPSSSLALSMSCLQLSPHLLQIVSSAPIMIRLSIVSIFFPNAAMCKAVQRSSLLTLISMPTFTRITQAAVLPRFANSCKKVVPFRPDHPC